MKKGKTLIAAAFITVKFVLKYFNIIYGIWYSEQTFILLALNAYRFKVDVLSYLRNLMYCFTLLT